MPKYWYTKIKPKEDSELTEEDEFNNRICVDKKPYFFRYIYPDTNKSYSSFIKDTENKCNQIFGMTFEELQSLDELTDEQAEFIERYYKYIPVNDNGCTMNRLCHMVENEFKGFTSKLKSDNKFDYTILKSGNDYDYGRYLEIFDVYHRYVARMKSISANKNSYNISRDAFNEDLRLNSEMFKEKCDAICSNSVELCDILLDICYSTSKSKSFVWEMCGDQIIKNLLAKNDYQIKYIVKDNDGDIEFNGYKFSERIMRENADTE